MMAEAVVRAPVLFTVAGSFGSLRKVGHLTAAL